MSCRRRTTVAASVIAAALPSTIAAAVPTDDIDSGFAVALDLNTGLPFLIDPATGATTSLGAEIPVQLVQDGSRAGDGVLVEHESEGTWYIDDAGTVVSLPIDDQLSFDNDAFISRPHGDLVWIVADEDAGTARVVELATGTTTDLPVDFEEMDGLWAFPIYSPDERWGAIGDLAVDLADPEHTVSFDRRPVLDIGADGAAVILDDADTFSLAAAGTTDAEPLSVTPADAGAPLFVGDRLVALSPTVGLIDVTDGAATVLVEPSAFATTERVLFAVRLGGAAVLLTDGIDQSAVVDIDTGDVTTVVGDFGIYSDRWQIFDAQYQREGDPSLAPLTAVDLGTGEVVEVDIPAHPEGLTWDFEDVGGDRIVLYDACGNPGYIVDIRTSAAVEVPAYCQARLSADGEYVMWGGEDDQGNAELHVAPADDPISGRTIDGGGIPVTWT